MKQLAFVLSATLFASVALAQTKIHTPEENIAFVYCFNKDKIKLFGQQCFFAPADDLVKRVGLVSIQIKGQRFTYDPDAVGLTDLRKELALAKVLVRLSKDGPVIHIKSLSKEDQASILQRVGSREFGACLMDRPDPKIVLSPQVNVTLNVQGELHQLTVDASMFEHSTAMTKGLNMLPAGSPVGGDLYNNYHFGPPPAEDPKVDPRGAYLWIAPEWTSTKLEIQKAFFAEIDKQSGEIKSQIAVQSDMIVRNCLMAENPELADWLAGADRAHSLDDVSPALRSTLKRPDLIHMLGFSYDKIKSAGFWDGVSLTSAKIGSSFLIIYRSDFVPGPNSGFSKGSYQSSTADFTIGS